MLIFNCTKAAAEFFTTTYKGKKTIPVLPSAYKTITEAIENDNCDIEKTNNFKWQWIVDCISIKRKKYFMVIDYLTNYCLAFPTTPQGNNISFIDEFNKFLLVNFSFWATQKGVTTDEIAEYVMRYHTATKSCSFYQRTDSAVQESLESIVSQLKIIFIEDKPFTTDEEFLMFSIHISECSRRKDNNKRGYVYSHDLFVDFFVNEFSDNLVCSE
jgi:hypothetical protein